MASGVAEYGSEMLVRIFDAETGFEHRRSDHHIEAQ
jgi:hypothetical protein